MNKHRKKAIRLTVDLTLNRFVNSLDRALPIDIKKIVSTFPNCRLVPFSQHMKKFNFNYSEMIIFAETTDACTFYNAAQDKYLILFNDLDSNTMKSNRYRWNIAHELGHVVLQHHKISDKTRLFRNQLSKQEYKEFEDEADCFASYLLVPHVALYLLRIKGEQELKDYCKISKAAARIRTEEYLIWKQNNIYPNWDYRDKNLISIYKKAECRQFCTHCGNLFYSNIAKFCPICGHFTVLTAEEKENSMIYDDLIYLDDEGRVEKCPVCENDDIIEEAQFCQICGQPVFNKCTNPACGEIATGNARFCIHCSAPTTFGKYKVLCDYKEYQEKDLEGFLPDLDVEIPF